MKQDGKKTNEGVTVPIEEDVTPQHKATSEKLDESPSKAGGKDKVISVSPDIFVSLKKGIISDYYKIGKTLGEGNAYSLNQWIVKLLLSST